jgi:GNAT superfamily N-acetyltransferase
MKGNAMQQTHIRSATPNDVGVILQFIRELADYEKLLHCVEATEEKLNIDLFGAKPSAEVLIAELDGAAVGFALFFSNYSTFLAKPGIYLEDLYVREIARGRGLGLALIAHLAKLALQRGCGRLEWAVLNWNTPAIDFYRAIGAKPQDEWTVQRLTGDALQNMAAKAK